ncbi:DUF429 domain-containing protein [Halapricum hydrolyticum]|uniref:DUF429 domain-containing protein n=1 Tax=Halapricum hydrolyticum TaxID=2979991 RepID=A0AAE3LHM9_9EURY|nr:DUF429 domain-containing protein [Halapricum hydrolyticum]MCU4717929.1 DUF429 domain-containing protein [Halapricum hydrolyticum]MCU4727094.1 DUF429 domain-containing protein [Halapricum hydrolyticum]
MARYVGVDWASRGWLTVATDGDDWTASMHPSMHSVWLTYRDAAAILVDVPIGLPETRRRECDRAAKAFLGDRSSSVFWTPCRAAVEAPTYEQARRANEDCRGDGLSSQAWGLIPRIQEVDRLLRDEVDAETTILESHPEVCFTALHGGESLPSKHDEDGIEARRTVLEAVDDSIAGVYERFEATLIDGQPPWARRIGESNRDDLLDAMVLTLTAKYGAGGFRRFPEDPPLDAEGLPMQIVYTDRRAVSRR